MEDKKTPFEVKCIILADLWINYRKEDDFEDFLQYNDIGLPAAWMVAEELCKPSEKLKGMIGETFMLLLEALGIEEDTGFDSLDDLLVG